MGNVVDGQPNRSNYHSRLEHLSNCSARVSSENHILKRIGVSGKYSGSIHQIGSCRSELKINYIFIENENRSKVL